LIVRRPRFRIRSMMVAVLLAALGSAVWAHFSRLEPGDFAIRMTMFAALQLPILLLIYLKFAFRTGARWKKLEVEVRRDQRGVGPPSPSSSDGTRGIEKVVVATLAAGPRRPVAVRPRRGG
jgi:hypothetical protein